VLSSIEPMRLVIRITLGAWMQLPSKATVAPEGELAFTSNWQPQTARQSSASRLVRSTMPALGISPIDRQRHRAAPQGRLESLSPEVSPAPPPAHTGFQLPAMAGGRPPTTSLTAPRS